MCDTMVALGGATADGSVIFAKNSDREPDECQNIEVPSRRRASGEVRCTYISVPEAGEPFRALLCRPFWMWGAEMGVNERGVAIGNEALFTREKPAAVGLTGMDLLRLALERAGTAAEAREVIIELLETHGQGGRAGYRHHLEYMNGFLIADPAEAYVLETAGKMWAWKKVKDFWTISNVISITDDFDAVSEGLIERAIKKGWAKSESDFNFRRCYSDRLFTWGAQGAPRESCSRRAIKDAAGGLTPRQAMDILRLHADDWRPDRQKGGTVCMHAASSLLRPTQSTGSLVARLCKERSDLYVTAAANPCMSMFFPVSMEGAPTEYRPGGAEYDAASYWWEAERLHRKALGRFEKALVSIRELLDAHEPGMVERVARGEDSGLAATDKYFARALDVNARWGKGLADIPPEPTRFFFRRYWRKYNRKNRVPELG